MAWRRVHLDNEVWEWQVSKSSSDMIVIRAPSKVVTTIKANWLGTVDACDIFVKITPSNVKAYIKHNQATLMGKPKRRRKPKSD
jgi:hypothetical protein